ncbi:MAG: DUF805 domain-containing protein [Pikeienuella sp.]
MNMVGAVKSCMSKYVTFSGRASRAEYWWFYLAVMIAYFVASIADGILGTLGILVAIVALGCILPFLSVFVRRLHDIGKSGWWYWIGVIPVVGTIIIIVFLVRKGEEGSNQYGENPYDVFSPDVFS